MSKPDGGIWGGWLRPGWAGLRGLDVTRIEGVPGFPDLELCWLGHAGWIELKIAHRPVRSTTGIQMPHRVTREQAIWLRRRWRAGGSVWILLRLGKGHGATRHMIPGYLAAWLRHRPTEDELLTHPHVIEVRTPRAVLMPLVAGVRAFPSGT